MMTIIFLLKQVLVLTRTISEFFPKLSLPFCKYAVQLFFQLEWQAGASMVTKAIFFHPIAL